MSIHEILAAADDLVWGSLLVVLLLGTGVWLTVRTRFVQVFHLGKALKWMVKNEEEGTGEVSSFGALCTALSATIGTGNIVGVATAITIGGPGALFWMWVSAFFGMATKYTEGFLAIQFRTVDKNGHALGGPFYYIERGLRDILGGNPKWLGKRFAAFGTLAGLLGIGTFTQINGIADAMSRLFQSDTLCIVGNKPISLTVILTGGAVTFFAALVVLGGIQRIAKVTGIIVPFVAVAYVLFALVLLLANATAIPAAVALVCKTAFSGEALGGAISGWTLKTAIRIGVGRGIFSNEAGLGSAPIAAAAAQTTSPVRQGLVTMTGTFIDTLVICTMTGLSIVVTGAWNPQVTGEALEGFAVTAWAWEHGFPHLPATIPLTVLSLCLAVFAFTTILGWNYYSERCLEYLIGGNKKGVLQTFRVLYLLAVAVGPYLTVTAVWDIADIFNALMAFPNLVALLLLSGVVGRETTAYFKQKTRD